MARSKSSGSVTPRPVEVIVDDHVCLDDLTRRSTAPTGRPHDRVTEHTRIVNRSRVHLVATIRARRVSQELARGRGHRSDDVFARPTFPIGEGVTDRGSDAEAVRADLIALDGPPGRAGRDDTSSNRPSDPGFPPPPPGLCRDSAFAPPYRRNLRGSARSSNGVAHRPLTPSLTRRPQEEDSAGRSPTPAQAT